MGGLWNHTHTHSTAELSLNPPNTLRRTVLRHKPPSIVSPHPHSQQERAQDKDSTSHTQETESHDHSMLSNRQSCYAAERCDLTFPTGGPTPVTDEQDDMLGLPSVSTTHTRHTRIPVHTLLHCTRTAAMQATTTATAAATTAATSDDNDCHTQTHNILRYTSTTEGQAQMQKSPVCLAHTHTHTRIHHHMPRTPPLSPHQQT